MADLPRPFVFRAMGLDGKIVPPGERFEFGLNLFDLRNPPVAALAEAFADVGREGMGPGRGRAELEGVRCAGRLAATEPLEPVTLSLDPEPAPVERVCVRFVTPTELKTSGGLAERPEFGPLACRIRDRVSGLRALYGPGPLEMDFRAFGEAAARVDIARCQIEHVAASRRSSRTGQSHPLGGFTGEVEYVGALTGFIPFLKAARFTGVGRQTAWGKGEIEVL
jgi:hypothetical protein